VSSASRISVSEDMIPVQRPDVLAQGVLEEMVLYDGDSEMGYSLNASAKAIWDCCDGSRNVRQICDDLSSTFDITPDLLLEDVRLALRQLLTLGLIQDKRLPVGSPERIT
jgi:hypothetical protein